MDNEAETLRAMLGVDEARPGWTLGHRAGSRIRILHSSTSATVAATPRQHSERRREERLTPDQSGWADAARLRPGVDVRVVDIGPRGVLIEAPARLHVGTHVELALFASDTPRRLDVIGVVRRCHVSSLNPLTYRGALEFTTSIDVHAIEPFLSTRALSA
jgi:hypothetical protein